MNRRKFMLNGLIGVAGFCIFPFSKLPNLKETQYRDKYDGPNYGCLYISPNNQVYFIDSTGNEYKIEELYSEELG